MATHDYVIDNQTAPNFRADLNNALAAIVTQNSNATAPTVTYANMFWYDTAANQLKKRNEANSAWIILGTIDEGTGTFTPSGQPALASQAQAEAGTDNTTVMTPLRVTQAIDALGNPADYQSAQQTIAIGSTFTLSHGLGKLPSNVQVWLVAVANSEGYTSGDWYGPVGAETFADGANTGVAIAMNTTQVKIKLGSQSTNILNFSTGSRTGLTFANWRLVVRAWK
jgi:hypothetical protein